MLNLFCAAVVAVSASAAGFAEKTVTVGGMSEGNFGMETPQTIQREGLGDLTVLFISKPWKPEVLRELASFCRTNGMKFTMDEVMDRRNKGVQPRYREIVGEVAKVLKENSDVVEGSLMMCEYCGVMCGWPLSSVAGCNRIMPAVKTYAEAERYAVGRLREAMADAEALGLPRPYISIEPQPGDPSLLYRGGIDRVDIEMMCGDETERALALQLGAARAYGKPTYGADMAMVWFGGSQRDELWFKRWRNSLSLMYLRGADPIYAEHGLMNYHANGIREPADAPKVKRFRAELADFAAWAKKNPRPVGLPDAAFGVIRGRHDGYTGFWQTHVWGQRTNDAWRCGAADDSWWIFDRLYGRNRMEDRSKWGEVDWSGNPPLGSADIVPAEASDETLAGYKTLVFLGRNEMDDELYAKLVRYVKGGGTLLLAASHLDTAESPDAPYRPYRNGDWRELLGVRAVPGEEDRMEYGLKFVARPPCGWQLRLLDAMCDPQFSEGGGFKAVKVENCGAQVLAVKSEAFSETRKILAKAPPIMYAHRLGKGCAVFVPSVEPPGSRGLRPLYSYLFDRAAEAVDVWPKVECPERVRWASYQGGRVVYVFNTEERLRSEAIVRFSASAPERRIMLEPGEIVRLDRSAPPQL